MFECTMKQMSLLRSSIRRLHVARQPGMQHGSTARQGAGCRGPKHLMPQDAHPMLAFSSQFSPLSGGLPGSIGCPLDSVTNA